MPLRSRRPRLPRYAVRPRPSWVERNYLAPFAATAPSPLAVRRLADTLAARSATVARTLRTELATGSSFGSSFGSSLVEDLFTSSAITPLVTAVLNDPASSGPLLDVLTELLMSISAPAGAVELDRILTGIDPSVSSTSTPRTVPATHTPAPRPFTTNPFSSRTWTRALPALTPDAQRTFLSYADAAGSSPAAYPGSPVPSLPPNIPTTPPPSAFSSHAPDEGAWLRLRLDAIDPRARAWAAERGAQLVVEINQHQGDLIRDTISRLTANPETRVTIDDAIGLIADNVGLHRRWAQAVNNRFLGMIDAGADPSFAARIARDYATDLRHKRAAMIVRTETLAAANAGREQAWAVGIDTGLLPRTLGREFLTAPEGTRVGGRRGKGGRLIDGPCDICRPLNGQVVEGLDEKFVHPVTGAMYQSPPLHPHCRCVTLPVVPEIR